MFKKIVKAVNLHKNTALQNTMNWIQSLHCNDLELLTNMKLTSAKRIRMICNVTIGAE
jgi:hypothetical protein